MGRQIEHQVGQHEVARVEGHLPSNPSGTIEEVGQRIIALNAEARSIAVGAREQTQAALEKAFECGQWLAYAKDTLGHGKWLPWLETLGINRRTASNYIGLSNGYDRSHLLECSRNLTHAMQLAGVRGPEPTKADPEDQSTKTRLPESLDAIAVSFKRWQQTQLNPNISNATDALLLKWEAALRPMHLSYKAVEERLRK